MFRSALPAGLAALMLAACAHSQAPAETITGQAGSPGPTARYDSADHSQDVTECDLLASHPDDPDRIGPGIPEGEVDLPAAIEACSAAVAADPDNPRLRYQLARAYGYSGMGEKAMPHRMAAIEAGYPQSLFVVGYLYVHGRTIEQDVCRGADLIYRSALVGRFAGLVAYPGYLMDGVFEGCDAPADPEELRQFLEQAEVKADGFYRERLVASLKAQLSQRADLDAVMACHRAASHPDDPDRIAPGLEREEIDLPAAIEACERAFAHAPLDGRVNYHLGRVLYYDGRPDDSLPYLARAAAAGYRQAIFVLGYVRAVDARLGTDLCRAGSMWQAGVDLGHPWSGYHLAEKALDGAFADCDAGVSDARLEEAMCLARRDITAKASGGRVEALYARYLEQSGDPCR